MPQDFLSLITDLPRQLRLGPQLATGIRIKGDVSQIVVCGMGGSGMPGEFLKAALRQQKILVTLCKDYALPATVDRKALVFIVSYSGNPEETLSMLTDARQKYCENIVIITSGGKLANIAAKEHIPIATLPSGYPQRTAFGMAFSTMIAILEHASLAPPLSEHLSRIATFLEKAKMQAVAQELAEKLVGRIPIIICYPPLEAAALRWKQALHENAKVPAFVSVLPEMNHHEMIGYSSAAKLGHFFALFLKDEDEQRQREKRMTLTKQTLISLGIPSLEIKIKGDDSLTKLFSAAQLGDYVSYFLAQHYGADPLDIKLIEEFKRKL